MNATETIVNMIEDSKLAPLNYGPSGEPWRRAIKIINGHHVQTNLFGWDAKVKVWIDKSSEPLTIAEAATRIAA